MSLPANPSAADAADEALAEALADALVERAATDPAILRLALRAARGTIPAEMTLDQLAAYHGTDRHALNRIATRALTKLRLSPELQSIRRI